MKATDQLKAEHEGLNFWIPWQEPIWRISRPDSLGYRLCRTLYPSILLIGSTQKEGLALCR